jgi:phosphatidylserine decarboxylase
MPAQLIVMLQRLLPRHLLTALVYRITRIRSPKIKDFLIRRFIDGFKVATDEIKLDVPTDFATFNDFFIRELKSDARPIAADPAVLVSPVDGTVSSAGPLLADSIFQAKGLSYTLDDLLATDIDDARVYVDGNYATIYLAPYNYHRVHALMSGELVAARYVPGDLFSVNANTVAKLPGLFYRNERLILHFDTTHGPAILILVGALNVGSISTTWGGEIRPRKSGVVEVLDLPAGSRKVAKGDLLGWFNMGSTVIALLPKGASDWSDKLQAGARLKMGEAIGQLRDRKA